MSVLQHQLVYMAGGGQEVLRYEVSEGTRALVAFQGPRGAELVDLPADGAGGVAYAVDAMIEDVAEHLAFLEDYVRQAQRLDACPMSSAGIDEMLERSESPMLEALAAAVAGH